MDAILQALLDHYGFLYKEHSYRLVDSEYWDSFGGNGYIALASPRLQVRFTRERSRTFLDFKEPTAGEDGWQHYDLVYRLLTGVELPEGTWDDLDPAFLRENLTKIESLFDDSNLSATKRSIDEIIRSRTREQRQAQRRAAE